MSMKLDDHKDKIDEFFESGEAYKYFQSLEKRQEIYNARLERCWNKYGVNINPIMDKIIEKYESDKYLDRELNAGREPIDTLYNFFLNYARKYGIDEDESTWMDQDFTYESYTIGDYNFTLFCGQGCFIRVTKLTN